MMQVQAVDCGPGCGTAGLADGPTALRQDRGAGWLEGWWGLWMAAARGLGQDPTR